MIKINKKFIIILLTAVLIFSLIPVLSPLLPVRANPDWTKDAANPVITRGAISGAPCVVYDSTAGLYKMWYTHVTGDPGEFNTLVSNILGLSLGNLINDLKSHSFSNVANNDSAGVKNIIDYLASLTNTQLQNLINSADSTISYATSIDGTAWQIQSDVLLQGTAGQWDNSLVGAPCVIMNSSSSYEMWYTGASTDVADLATFLDHLALLSSDNIKTLLLDLVNSNLSAFITDARAARGDSYLVSLILDIINLLNSTNLAIGHATSSNGIAWTKDVSNPVLVKGTGSAWDKYGVGFPSIIRNSATDYHLWYSGFGIDYNAMLGLLTATNISDIETTFVAATTVAIGHATSSNGTNWAKDASNPVLAKGTGSVWDKYGVATPSVLKDSSGYYQMWYTGFTAIPGTLLNFINGTTGLENALINGTNSAIGHAISADGAGWTKDTANPLVTKGVGNVWDKYGAAAPSVSIVSGLYHMYYTGATSAIASLVQNILNGNSLAAALTNSGSRIAIGHAYSPVVTTTLSGTGGGGGGITTPPPGTTSVSSVIDADGNFTQATTALSSDGLCQITIPANTKGLQANGTPLTEITMVQSSLPAAPPPNISVAGLVYSFGPAGATFSPPVTLTFTYDPSLLPAGVTEATLYIAHYNATTGVWEKLPSVVNTTNHTITALVSSFSDFAILVPVRPAAFTTSNLIISPAELNVGSKVNISLTVSNTGDLRGSYRVTLKINNAAAESKDVTLAGGASQSVAFSVTGSTTGSYIVSIDNLSGMFTVKAPATPTPTPTPAPAPKPTSTPTPTAVPVPPASPSAPPVTPPSPAPGAFLPWWAWVVIGVVVVAIVAVLITRRGR